MVTIEGQQDKYVCSGFLLFISMTLLVTIVFTYIYYDVFQL